MTKKNLSLSLVSVLYLQIAWLLHSCFSRRPAGQQHMRYPDFTSNHFSRTVVLDLSQKIVSADCTNRPSVVINGSFPGPQLSFQVGETVKITVRNHLLDQNATIHFHGLSQYGSPFSDGTEKVSQFAIPAGGSYDYIFRLDKAGTYVYHAHVQLQLITCHGAFIVKEIHSPPFKYDDEIVMLFADYYHALDGPIIEGLTAAPFKFLGEPQALLVNGKALGTCDSTSPHGCSTGCHHHVINVKPGKTYRVRVISITTLTYIYLGIEEHHDLTVIEADAGYVRPVSTQHIQVHSGQRYSFLLKTKSHSELQKLGKREFWGRLETRWRPIRDQGAFILRYPTDSQSTPQGKNFHLDLSLSPLSDIKKFSKMVLLPDEGEKWLTEQFEPLDSQEIAPQAREVTRRIIIKGQQIKARDGHITWVVNDKKYVETEPNVPFLVKAYTKPLKPDYKASLKQNSYDSKLGAYVVEPNDVVEFVILNQASQSGVTEAHPWHLHGAEFYVIAQGTGEFSNAKLAESEARFKRTHILRDTQVVLSSRQGASYSNTTVPANAVTGWLVIRMRAFDHGAYLLHCHIQPHMTMGMGVVILVGIDQLPPLPPAYLKNYIHPPK